MGRRGPFWRGGRARAPWERRWEDDPSNRAWLDEIEAAIDAGDDARLVRAQAAVRLAPADRPPLAGAASAVVFREVPQQAGVVDVQLPPMPEDEEVRETPVLTREPGRKLRGAYARRQARQEAGHG